MCRKDKQKMSVIQNSVKTPAVGNSCTEVLS